MSLGKNSSGGPSVASRESGSISGDEFGDESIMPVQDSAASMSSCASSMPPNGRDTDPSMELLPATCRSFSARSSGSADGR
eukprot:CAMPEP_0175446212 /NCGR_PEP_ID=MMETSP0095-20121207/60157_1 /TAXON_ID=311494 /ORGANISM="Alexandrium monilatum, Strain CCMP3105" /LENGTH=80 /DNA_ID=CAMNT_0016746485 /DNA_START=28 /DNA_END=267 /DNA_ORIENTATION=+